MGIVTGILVYVIMWWLIFFMSLPWGVQPIEEMDKGYERGAPAQPRLLLKVVVTTGITTVLFMLYVWFVPADMLLWPVFRES